MVIKRGFTLIELVVSMTIFIIVITLAVGGFIAINKSRITLGGQKDTQQKLRIADETITRYAKEAEIVRLPDTPAVPDQHKQKQIELYFDMMLTPGKSAKKFEMTSAGILGLSDCPSDQIQSTGKCGADDISWNTASNLLGGVGSSAVSLDYNTSYFLVNQSIPPYLTLKLVLPGSSGDITLDDAIILENIK